MWGVGKIYIFIVALRFVDKQEKCWRKPDLTLNQDSLEGPVVLHLCVRESLMWTTTTL